MIATCNGDGKGNDSNERSREYVQRERKRGRGEVVEKYGRTAYTDRA